MRGRPRWNLAPLQITKCFQTPQMTNTCRCSLPIRGGSLVLENTFGFELDCQLQGPSSRPREVPAHFKTCAFTTSGKDPVALREQQMRVSTQKVLNVKKNPFNVGEKMGNVQENCDRAFNVQKPGFNVKRKGIPEYTPHTHHTPHTPHTPHTHTHHTHHTHTPHTHTRARRCLTGEAKGRLYPSSN